MTLRNHDTLFYRLLRRVDWIEIILILDSVSDAVERRVTVKRITVTTLPLKKRTMRSLQSRAGNVDRQHLRVEEEWASWTIFISLKTTCSVSEWRSLCRNTWWMSKRCSFRIRTGSLTICPLLEYSKCSRDRGSLQSNNVGGKGKERNRKWGKGTLHLVGYGTKSTHFEWNNFIVFLWKHWLTLVNRSTIPCRP